jgi:alpha-tubulin suppressor-like RCC1 family protein
VERGLLSFARPRVLVLGVGALVVLGGLLAGCASRGAFHCQEKDQCGVNGFCESTGACSVADGTCESGRRYRSYVPDALADRCVNDACPNNPVVRLRAGGDHACLLRKDGNVSCWGQGASGELGDGGGVARSTLEVVAGIPIPVTDLALGDSHTCVVASGGAVWCWGANASGQLGDGTTFSRALPGAVSGIDDAIAVVAGGAFTCALRATHTVACWGKNTSGELGQGASGEPVLLPAAIPQLADVDLLTAADRHACAATPAGELYCWGSNSQGELGDGTSTDRSLPTRVAALQPGGGNLTALAAGVAHTCAIAAGQIYCWGANQLGERGDGNDATTAAPTPPSLVSALGGVTDIAAAGHHTCAIEENGTAWCWGANQAGQLGEGTTTNIGVPVPVSQLGAAAALAAGDSFSCALRRDGTVWCWGDDRLGQLGTGSRVDRVTPTEVAHLTGALVLAVGGAHTCAALSGTTDALELGCWGANQAGQLGDGTRIDRGSAAPLKISLDARELVAGALHTCLGAPDGGVWCWGRGSRGQLGATLMIDSVVPVAAVGLTGATHLAAGGAHTCAVRGAGGGVACWGANDEGQLGGGSFDKPTGVVTVVNIADDVAQLALGAAHTCARLSNGRVMCWGRGTQGQLGDGHMTSAGSPVEVSGIVDATAIAAGDDHTCVVSRAGAVSCWGAGADGQLGSESNDDRAFPALAADLHEVVEIAAGARHSCARSAVDGSALTPGELHCWGANREGQLGDGTRTSRPRVAPMPILNDALAIGAGGSHTCAVRADHRIVCFGDDTSGQLGNGRTLQFPTAQPARITCSSAASSP